MCSFSQNQERITIQEVDGTEKKVVDWIGRRMVCRVELRVVRWGVERNYLYINASAIFRVAVFTTLISVK